MAVVTIGRRQVGDGQEPFIIAELGINHNGSLETAKKLIDAAVKAGAHAVKFQKRSVTTVYTPEELDTPRQVPRELLEDAIGRGALPQSNVERLQKSDFVDTRNGDLKWALEFKEEEYKEIYRYCKEKGILWFASPWEEESVDFLEQFNPPAYKIASASLTDDDFLRYVRSKGCPVILSTGMSDLPMIEHAVDVLSKDNLILLHCTSVYPTKVEESDHGLSMLNLKGLETLRTKFGVPVGFSSHDTGIMPSYAAAVLGACIIEKHLTLYRAMWGSDQAASIEPNRLGDLCRMVKELKIAMGDGDIRFYPDEVPVAKKLRRKWGKWQKPA